MPEKYEGLDLTASPISRELARYGIEHVEEFIADNLQDLPFNPPPHQSILDKVSSIIDNDIMQARLAFAAGFPYRADHYAGVPASPPQVSSIAGPSSMIGRVINLSS